MVGVAIAGAAVVGAGASMAAAGKQSSAAKRAAGLQHDATLASIAEQRRQFDLTRGDFAPYREVGVGALGALADLFLPGGAAGVGGTFGLGPEPPRTIRRQVGTRTAPGRPETRGLFRSGNAWVNRNGDIVAQVGDPGFEETVQEPIFEEVPNPEWQAWNEAMQAAQGEGPDYSAFFKSPGYQFRLEEGQRALERSAAAGGRLHSGRTGRELVRYGQGVASNEFGNYANRLAALAGIGQSATGSTAAAGQATAGNIQNALMSGAANRGNALMGAGTARASGYAGAANALSGGVNNFLLMQALQNQGGPTAAQASRANAMNVGWI